jgi:hypothetical protein
MWRTSPPYPSLYTLSPTKQLDLRKPTVQLPSTSPSATTQLVWPPGLWAWRWHWEPRVWDNQWRHRSRRHGGMSHATITAFYNALFFFPLFEFSFILAKCNRIWYLYSTPVYDVDISLYLFYYFLTIMAIPATLALSGPMNLFELFSFDYEPILFS